MPTIIKNEWADIRIDHYYINIYSDSHKTALFLNMGDNPLFRRYIYNFQM